MQQGYFFLNPDGTQKSYLSVPCWEGRGDAPIVLNRDTLVTFDTLIPSNVVFRSFDGAVKAKYPLKDSLSARNIIKINDSSVLLPLFNRVVVLDSNGAVLAEKPFFSPDASVEKNGDILVTHSEMINGRSTRIISILDSKLTTLQELQLPGTITIKPPLRLSDGGLVMPIDELQMPSTHTVSILFLNADGSTRAKFPLTTGYLHFPIQLLPDGTVVVLDDNDNSEKSRLLFLSPQGAELGRYGFPERQLTAPLILGDGSIVAVESWKAVIIQLRNGL